ncbi:hypothetical protein, partial [Microbacterium algeriense]|uniref:hypothetical protein n=1 Tax=Microbacterium algeriense TaxID=2615184 RepID=UPI0029BC94D8
LAALAGTGARQAGRCARGRAAARPTGWVRCACLWLAVSGWLVSVRMPVTSLPLSEIVEIHRILDTHHAVGKTVVDLSDNPHLPQEA